MKRGRKPKEKIVWGGWPTSHTESESLAGAIINAAESMKIVLEEKANIKEIYKDIKEETGIPARHFNFLVKCRLEEESKRDLEEKTEALISDAEAFMVALAKMENTE